MWAFLIGAWILMKVLGSVSKSNPALAPFVNPIIGIYVAFVVLTWVGEPLFNTLLKFHPLGKHLLDDDERLAANWVAGLFGAGLVSLGIGFAADISQLTLAGMLSLAMTIPTGNGFSHRSTKAGKGLMTYTIVLAVLAVGALVGPSAILVLFFLAFILYFWISNYLVSRT